MVKGGTGFLRFSFRTRAFTRNSARTGSSSARIRLLLRGDRGLLPIHPREARGKLGSDPVRSGELGRDAPVLRRDEGPDLLLAVHDQTQGHGLHPPCGNAATDLLPEEGADLVPYQPIQDAPRLLRVYLSRINVPRMGEGLLNRPLRDLIEHHPVNWPPGALQLLGQMPADRFPLTIRVGCQIDGGGGLRGFLEVAQHLLPAPDDLELGRKIIFHVYRQRLDGQIADVTHRGLDRELLPQELVDGLGLGWGFNNHQGLRHVLGPLSVQRFQLNRQVAMDAKFVQRLRPQA